MAYWILKTEPSEYAFATLQRDGRTRWEGISNAQALIHLRQMASGDQAMIYHTGDERALVGHATIASDPYPDPALNDPRRVVVDVLAGPPLARLIPLAELKADPALKDLGLVRHGRLSVVPVSPAQWHRLESLAC